MTGPSRNYGQALVLIPDHIETLRHRALAYKGKGDHALALRDLDRVIRLEPGQPRDYRERAFVYAQMGEFEQALLDAQEMMRLKPDNAGAYYVRGEVYRVQGDWPQAISGLRPGDPAGSERGRLLRAAGDASCSGRSRRTRRSGTTTRRSG